MASKDRQNLIGFDPLAWIGDDQEPEKPAVFEDEQPLARPGGADKREAAAAEAAGDGPVNELAIELDSILSVQTVAELCTQLAAAFPSARSIAIDAAAVEVADTATLQLLVVVQREAVQAGKSFSIDFPSERFIEAARLLGVASLLEVEHPESGLF
ncbi:MAG: STAS domain-containing protein [Gammaproteobacteria bacterium]